MAVEEYTLGYVYKELCDIKPKIYGSGGIHNNYDFVKFKRITENFVAKV
jgi:hypothetical protein